MSDRILDPAPELMRLIGLKLSELPKRFFKMPLRLYHPGNAEAEVVELVRAASQR